MIIDIFGASTSFLEEKDKSSQLRKYVSMAHLSYISTSVYDPIFNFNQ